MSIPESQLETWSSQGSIRQSSQTYNTVKGALESSDAPYAAQQFAVFLQGSYGNDTNIYAESDVDTVIRLDSIFQGDVSGLSPDQQVAYHQTLGARPWYTFDEFKQGVIARLVGVFGRDDVKPGNKAIKIESRSSRRSADVLACYEFRRYTRFVNAYDQQYVSGVYFPTYSSGAVVNYPRVHSDNCTAKHQATNGWFKPMVRILKNMRSWMVSRGALMSGTAPSYYIECLLHNVPNGLFHTSYAATFVECLTWLQHTNRSTLACAHGQHLLLGNSNVNWPSNDCDAFISALVILWNGWR